MSDIEDLTSQAPKREKKSLVLNAFVEMCEWNRLNAPHM
jgi:hypothetical protein